MRLRTVAFSNLRRRKSRAAFLVAGLLVGIGTVVTLLTLSPALTVQAQNNLETFGANIVVAPRTRRALADLRRRARSAASRSGARDIREADLARIATIANRRNIAIVAPELLGAVSVERPPGPAHGRAARGRVRAQEVVDASTGGRRADGHELVAGSAAAAALQPAPWATGSASTAAPFTVTGILRPTGSQDDDLLITDLAAAQGVLAQAGQGLDGRGRGAVQQLPGRRRSSPSSAACCPGTKVTAMQEKVKNRMHAIDQFRTFS